MSKLAVSKRQHQKPQVTSEKKFETRDVHVSYGDDEAIKGVSLDMFQNEVTALIGPSGCGKTTYLRCLNRMNDTIPGCQVTGQILLDGADIYDPSVDVVQLRARVGMVFQKPNPFPKSVYDNVCYGPKIHGLARVRADYDIIVEQSLRMAGLWNEVKDRLQLPGTSLSGGQQQRLCIARAIAVSPEVILMDEPCSSLDPIATAKNRRADGRAQKELRNRYRYSFDATGGSGFTAYGLFSSRRTGRKRQYRRTVHQPHRGADPRLYHRAFWISANLGETHGFRTYCFSL